MKLIAAIALFVLSLALAVVGVADRTIWAPEPTKTLSVEFDSGYPYVVIPEATLGTYAGNPTITVSGSKKAFIARKRSLLPIAALMTAGSEATPAGPISGRAEIKLVK